MRKANAISTVCFFLLLLTYGRRASGIPAWPAQVLMYDTEPTVRASPEYSCDALLVNATGNAQEGKLFRHFGRRDPRHRGWQGLFGYRCASI